MYNSISGTLSVSKPLLTCIKTNSGLEFTINTPLSVYDRYHLNINTNPVITLYTHLVVREDDMSLYGFNTEEERNIFTLFVTKIGGLGPKTSLSILSTFNLSELSQIVSDNNSKHLSTVPGIGPKTAAKLLLELKDKFPKHISTTITSSATTNLDLINDAILVLTTLGLSETQAKAKVESLLKKEPTLSDVSIIAQKVLSS